MVKANLIFTQLTNSFSVKIPNLEKLSVEQIQELELFVSQRKGIFDFNTYSFVIQKRLEFREFLLLLQSINIQANVTQNTIEKKTEPRIGFGQYKGMQYNELPNSYILWLKSNYRGEDREIIDREILNRKL